MSSDPKPEASLLAACHRLAPWMSAALGDDEACAELKADATAFLEALESAPQPESAEAVCPRCGAAEVSGAACPRCGNLKPFSAPPRPEAGDRVCPNTLQACACGKFDPCSAQQASAPVGVEKAARRLLEAYDDDAHPFEAAGAAEELRNALTQQPAARRLYFYKVNDCPADGPREPDCICWHDEGTRPLAGGTAKTWRDVPVQQPAAVDGAMVERALVAFWGRHWNEDVEIGADRAEDMRRALTAALAGQQQGRPRE